MIVKQNRLLNESAQNAGRIMQQEISSSNHFSQQQDMTFGRMAQDASLSDLGVNNEDNDEENIVIDMVDEDEDDDEPDNQKDMISAQRSHRANKGITNHHHQNNTTNESQSSDDQHLDSESRDIEQQQQFNVGDLIWLDPNQLGYAIPGKVLDFYPELNVLTVEGCCQPLALEDPQLDEQTRNRLLVKADEQLQVYELSSDLQSFRSIRFRQPIGSSFGLPDLTQLKELSNESIIWNLKLRFKQNLIYTKCGHKILVSINPYKQLSELYNLDQVNQYDTIKNQPKLANLNYLAHNKFIRWLTLHQQQKLNNLSRPLSSQPASGLHEGAPESGIAPHIFELANEALKKLLIHCQDQCFVLLGDSGSGKTEAAKLLVQYFATVNKSPTNLMTEQILESIQMLESFGNAKTLLNNNSSRFGKLLEIRFSLNNGFIQDARTVDLNLLDRSRIVCQNEGERNFNVFYELLAGLNKGEKEKYGLQTAEKYFYLNQGHCVDLSQKEDGEDFRSLLGSMQVLGFTYEEQDTIFRVLAAILHLGNIYFHRKVLAIRSGIGSRDTHPTSDKSNGDGGVEGVEIGSDTEARWVSHLLQVQFDLVMRCLTVRTVEVAGQQQQQQHQQQQQRETSATTKRGPLDCIVTPLNIDQALDTRDAIARALYTCLFKWLVQRINLMINENAVAGSRNDNQTASTNDKTMDNHVGDQLPADEEPIYLCRTSESLCEFQPDKLVANRRLPTVQSRAHLQQSPIKQPQRTALISILDAFGFENLTENNFEQLCINYAAELLHYQTNRYLIRLEQVEYSRERIKWQPMTGSNYIDPTYEFRDGNGNKLHATTGGGGNSFSSNSSTLAKHHKQAAAIVNLISKKPLGILALLDDECNFPKATDQSFAEKCHHNHALNENYQCARLVANCQEFGIRHFKQASRMVWYQVDGFIEKNRDSLRPDVMELLLGSKMTIVADMLRKIHKPFGSASAFGGGGIAASANHAGEQSIYALANNGKTLSRTYDGRYVTMKPRAGTVATRFQDSLSNNLVLEALSIGGGGGSGRSDGQPSVLINNNGSNNNNYMSRSELSSHLACIESVLSNGEIKRPTADTWFIVCLKPNRTKSAQIFDVAYVQEQVRSMNLLELVHMRKFGFPMRLRYGDFLKRYKCLVTRKFLAASCGRHLKSNGGRQLRSNNLNQLDQCQVDNSNNLKNSTTSSRSSDRTNSIKRAMRNVCNSIIEFKLETIGQAEETTRHHQHHQCGSSKMFLSEWLFHQLEQMRLAQYQKSILIIQKTWKMWLIRREFLEQRRAVTVIQAQLRGLLARKQFLEQYSLIVALQRRWRHLLHIRQAERLEARRRMLKQQQQQQLLEWQAQQNKQANQLRFRLQAPTRATDKTLDIPEDLAQLYRLQRNWLPIHDLTNMKEFDLNELVQLEQLRRQRSNTSGLGRSVGGVPFIVVGSSVEQLDRKLNFGSDQVSSQIRQFLDKLDLDERYSTYALVTRYYSSKTPQFGYSRLPITRPFSWPKMMHYKRMALRRARRQILTGDCDTGGRSRSALKEQSIKRRFMALEQKAVAVYKLILRYIDTDQSFKLPPVDQYESQSNDAAQLMLQRLLKFKLISDYINYLCLVEPLLRDEVFLQLISQTWQNPKVKSQENCWKLMLDCLACFEPLDLKLAKHLLRYASEHSCDTYKKMICERLFEAYGRLAAASRRAGGAKRLALAAINSTPITSPQRQFPTTILEYWANQQALEQMSISASCYMDEHNNSSLEWSADSSGQSEGLSASRNCQLDRTGNANDNSVDEHIGNQIDDVTKDQLDTTNYSNRTTALVSSHSTAEQLARQLLSCRGVPDANLVGWSVEIQHEGVLSEFSSRLRGDDHLFDHFARLELLPELVQLVDDELEALECEQLDELGLGEQQHQTTPGGGELETRLANELESVPSCCRNVSPLPPSDDCCRPSGVNSNGYPNGYNKRLSVQSHRSWDFANHHTDQQSTLSPYACNSVALSDHDTQQLTHLKSSGRPQMHHHELDPMYHHSDYYDRNNSYATEQHSNYMMNSNRRSMSMQELQLAASSALNDRYFMQQQQASQFQATHSNHPGQPAHHYASSCLSSQCCGQAFNDGSQLPRSRRHSGSLRQLNQSRQGPFVPSGGVHYQSRRRSTTPNSMISNNRLSSSSAYGSHSSRFNANASSGSQSMHAKQSSSAYMSIASSMDGRQDRQHPPRHLQHDDQQQQRLGRSRPRASGHAANMVGRPVWSHRSASISSRSQNNGNKPSSDYASTHSDYDQVGCSGQQRLGGVANSRAHQQVDSGDIQRSRKLALDRRVPPVGITDPSIGGGQQYSSKSASVHYAATSSALSDTSEAPSLASHVRGIKVPQPNGDLDQYLDDLFNPLLDGADLDEMSDARSMATSIRGTGFDSLCDPIKLSRIIRGTEELRDNDQQEPLAELEQTRQQQRDQTLSPTFESLLKSLKGETDTNLLVVPGNEFTPQTSTSANLKELNLSQLKALNEKLESEIQAAQSARASLELKAGSSSSCDADSSTRTPPVPPPQPTFGHSTAVSVQQAEQLIDDIYSRAKTIRIGKWRWPPALNEQQQTQSETGDQMVVQLPSGGSEKKRASVLGSDLVASESQSKPDTNNAQDEDEAGPVEQVSDSGQQEDKQQQEQQHQIVPNVNASVGRLKISSEMKAKLEQLTNSGSTTTVQEPIVVTNQDNSRVDNVSTGETAEADQEQPRRLDAKRRNLLASQLLGAHNLSRASVTPEDGPSRRDSGQSQHASTGSKVLAVKQQLAAAAGVALSAFDSSHSGASSQTSSRRQSSCQPGQATNEQQRRLVLEADELGPQSRGAINQRQAFYLDANDNKRDSIAQVALKDGSSGLRPAQLSTNNDQATLEPSGAKSLNLCLLKHKQEISQTKVDGQQKSDEIDNNDDGDESKPIAAGQWVSSSSDCDKQTDMKNNRVYSDKRPVATTTNKREELVVRKNREVVKQQQQQQKAKTVTCLSHANVDWQIRVRKEVFKPSESYDNELVVQLIFAQLVADVFNPRHWTRLNNKERAAIKSIMKDNSIGYAPSLPGLGQMQEIKRELVRMARSFGLYFTRSYQALNFACLSENYLAGCRAAGDCNPFDCDDDSLGCCESTDEEEDSTSDLSDDSLFGEEHQTGDRQNNGNRTPWGPRLALRLAHRMQTSDRLGLEWIDMVAVHHSGLRLVALVCDQQQGQGAADRTSIRNSKQFIANQIGASPGGGGGGGPPTPPIGYKVLETLKFRDMTDVRLVSERVLLVSMRTTNSVGSAAQQARLSKSWLISSSQAQQLAALLKNFLADYNDNVRATSTSAASDLYCSGQKQSRKRLQHHQKTQPSEPSQPASESNNSNQSRSKLNKQQSGSTTTNSSNSNGGATKQPPTTSGPRNKWRENALLAFDDVHDGGHLEQRQAPNSVDKLRSAANPNNVLADAQRALPNDLANSHAPTSPTSANSSGHFGPSKQDGSSGGARGHSGEPQPAPVLSLQRSDPDSAHNKQQQQFRDRQSGSRSSGSSPASSPTSDNKRRQPGGGSDASRGRPDDLSPTATKIDTTEHGTHFASNESLDEPEQQPANTGHKQHRPTPTGGSNKLTGSGSKRATPTARKPSGLSSSSSSMWQNSLSRMSNRFSLFGGVHLSAASTLKQQFGGKKAKKRPGANSGVAPDDADEQLAPNDNGQPSQHTDVTLDAWIEAKMDFDGEEDELHEDQSEQVANAAFEPAENRQSQEYLESQSGNSDPKTDPTVSKSARGSQKQFGSLVAGSNSDEDNNNQNLGHKSSKADDGKYSMLQFALYNFREAIEKYSLETRLSIKKQNQNNSQTKDKQGHKSVPQDDWSTLRGSLKLIESLRTGGGGGGGGASSHNSSSSQSTISSTKTLTRIASQGATNDQHQQRAETQQVPGDWTWRELAQMVKFTSTPLKRPLLKLANNSDDLVAPSSSLQELERRAVECFAAIMRYMGDRQPCEPNNKSSGKQYQKQVPDNEVECVYLILINCHNHPELRDEIYCQLIKQTTNNRSVQPDSCLRGWRLFSLLAAYFDCSPHFRPYLLNYLEQNAFDKRRSYHSIALLCLQNLRKTFKYGGRKNVPSIEEIAALSAGRISKRQIYRLPGGTERVINTKSTTVVDDIIHEICSNMLMISEPNEMLEFSLYCIADGDLYTMPLNRDEYILDITTELIKNHQQYFLIFCRSIWHYPLRLDSKLYIEVTFNQIAPDYLEGLLLVLPRQHRKRSSNGSHYASTNANQTTKTNQSHPQQPLRLASKLVKEIARLAALLHRASGTDYMPHKDEIKYLLPKPIVVSIKQQLKANGRVRDQQSDVNELAAQVKDNELDDQSADTQVAPDQLTWVTLVQNNWREMSAFDTLDAKAQFLDIIRHWPLFGSSFFAIKLIQRDLIQPIDYILALNKLGIQMLDTQTHETHQKYSFNEVVSTRKVRSEDGALYLDMKCGNLMKRTIIRIQTDQAHEISRLVRQYIDIELSQTSGKQQQTSTQQQQSTTERRSSSSIGEDDKEDVTNNSIT